MTLKCVFINWACAVTAGNAQARSVSSCIRAVLFTGCQSQTASHPLASAEVLELSGTAAPLRWRHCHATRGDPVLSNGLLFIFNSPLWAILREKLPKWIGFTSQAHLGWSQWKTFWQGKSIKKSKTTQKKTEWLDEPSVCHIQNVFIFRSTANWASWLQPQASCWCVTTPWWAALLCGF